MKDVHGFVLSILRIRGSTLDIPRTIYMYLIIEHESRVPLTSLGEQTPVVIVEVNNEGVAGVDQGGGIVYWWPTSVVGQLFKNM